MRGLGVPTTPRDRLHSGQEKLRRISRGEIYWIPLQNQESVGKGIMHPQVVLQETVINQSRVSTVVVCSLSTNMKRAYEPGNVLLEPGEGNLEKRSVVIVSQVSAVEKDRIGAHIGSLSRERMDAIISGMKLQQNLAATNDPLMSDQERHEPGPITETP
jgi:mRNA interferase MazF